MDAHNALQQLYKSPYSILDPGDAGVIAPDRQFGICSLVTGASGETRTLIQPLKEGLVCTMSLDTDGGGDVVVTVTGGYNADADTAITLGDAGDFVALLSVKAGTSYYWRVLAQEGTNVALEDFSIDQLTATTATITTLNSPAGGTEHGVGFIGTAAAPTTTRRTVNGDLTGLTSKNTANDIIGLAAGGAAYLGRNVVATNGIIYKMELICLETPVGGDNDLSVYTGSAATDVYDGAVTGGAEKINGGDQVAGMVTVVTTPALTANHYYYLVAGTGDTAAIYTAGMFILRTYGHALLA
jgi:hypothetical protein